MLIIIIKLWPVSTFKDSCFCIELLRILSHFYVGSMFRMRLLHLTWSCASSPDSSLSDKSFLTLSNHLCFGLPLLLFPGTITLLPTYSYSLLNTCPYRFNLLFCTFLDISPTFAVPLFLLFLIIPNYLPLFITPHLHFVMSLATNCLLFSN